MFKTSDVWFSAFLISQGYEVKNYTVINRGKAEFYFEISDEKWKELKLSFNSSDLMKFKHIIDSLKDLCY